MLLGKHKEGLFILATILEDEGGYLHVFDIRISRYLAKKSTEEDNKGNDGNSDVREDSDV